MKSCVIFTGSTSFSVAKGIVKLALAYPDIDFKIYHHSPQRSVSTILRNRVKNIRRNGPRWIWYQASEILKSFRDGGTKDELISNVPGCAYEWPSLLEMPNVSLQSSSNVDSDDTAS